MSDNQNWNTFGKQMEGALADALKTGDFKNLNRLVSQTMASAVSEAGKPFTPYSGSQAGNSAASARAEAFTGSNTACSQAQAQAGSSAASAQANIPPWQQKIMEKQRQMQNWQVQMQRQQEQIRQREAFLRRQEAQLRQRQTQLQQEGGAQDSMVKFKKVGNVSNVLYQVFGGIGLGITGLVTFIRTIMLSFGETTFQGWVINLFFLSLFFGMIQLGVSQRRRLKRAERYVQLCDYRVHGKIQHLAVATGKSERYVRKDLQKMLQLGFFPEGHMDAGQTCFMVNDDVYRQYMEAEDARKVREAEAFRQQETQQEEPAPQVSGAQAQELNSMVAEGMECIRKLRDLNDRIPGEAISSKLFCLENLLKDIFDRVREHPEQMHKMHKLMDYYLPTTLKLVESYEEFNRVSSPGPEILEAKSEIENTLDTINQAFKELLGSLFQDAAFDATTDAQVLKTMLAKEGLTREMEYVTLGRDS